jgi:hypothetical protein
VTCSGCARGGRTGDRPQEGAAPQTPPETLPGTGTGQPPGQAAPCGHPVLQTLTAVECYDLLSPGGVGRVAFTTADAPVVLPVNYAMVGQTVIFRTALTRCSPGIWTARPDSRLTAWMRR